MCQDNRGEDRPKFLGLEDSRKRRQRFHDHQSRECCEFALFLATMCGCEPPSAGSGLYSEKTRIADTLLRMAVKCEAD